MTDLSVVIPVFTEEETVAVLLGGMAPLTRAPIDSQIRSACGGQPGIR